MNNISINVNNLSKRYRIGLRKELPDTFISATANIITRPIKNLHRLRKLTRFDGGKPREDVRQGEYGSQKADDLSPVLGRLSTSEASDIIWALRDVSFQVEGGEVVGIIGRNGAGKSTLLKILSRITHPTFGRVELNGRIASLIEVGTGFHPELTGRENIYLNGTILGMTRLEVDSKFDEIVDFSGVAKFIDTPIKFYSSGMRVRLGFSVAAHLEPEILLVDEVLAVGDLAFQKKCLGKMEEVSGAGRTVLFVSHNLQMIDDLCQRTILLDEGKIISDGSTDQVLRKYYEQFKKTKIGATTAIENRQNRRGTGRARFTEVITQDVEGKERSRFRAGENIRFRLSYEVFESVENMYTKILLRSGKTMET